MRSRVDAMRAEGVGGQAHGNHRYLVAVEAEQTAVRGVAGREGRYAPGQQSHLASVAYGKQEDGVDVGP